MKCFMSLRSPTNNEIALTPTLSHQNGRGNFSIQRAPNAFLFLTLARFAGEGRVRVPCLPSTLFSKEVTELY
jgi:hypothetical protein